MRYRRRLARQPVLRATMHTAVATIRVTFTSVAARDGRI
jgi:hypothetical protein